MTNSQLPGSEFIIIGGGAVGCAVAHALARAGKRDILVLERAAELGAITTSQGAGLCGQVRDSLERVQLARRSVVLFRELENDPEFKPDWHEVGSLRIALSARRAEEFGRLSAVSSTAGLEVELLGNKEAQGRWPALDLTSARAVLWCPSDGWMTPRCLVQAYAHQSRKLGVRFATDTAVESIVVQNERVTGVETNRGPIECSCVINAAGTAAYHIAKLVGLELPIVPVRHEYFVTVARPDLPPDLPCFRIPELSLYGRVRDGGLLLGGWEPTSLAVDPRTFTLDKGPAPVEPDWSVLRRFEEDFSQLLPGIKGAEKAVVGKGWPTFTPDGRFIIGKSKRVKGFVMAGGCNAHGISGSGGIGQLLVESLGTEPSAYVKSLGPDRFTEISWTWSEARQQARRVYETYYGV
jgi:glycine/D-amino acid oxidase-like deaminating enzyme